MVARLILAAIMCVLTLVLASCGGSGEGVTVGRVDTEQPLQPETPTEPMAPDAERKPRACYALSDSRKKTPLISLTSGALGFENVALGSVIVSGVLKLAVVRVVGLNLRWDFGDLGLVDALLSGGVWEEFKQHIQYAFVLEPDGTGLYYDFSTSDDGTAKPSQIFQCLRS